MALKVHVTQDRSFSRTVHLIGRLDHESVVILDSGLELILDSELDKLADQPVNVLVFDLADLEYIISAGLRSIFAARKGMAERAGQIVLLNAQPQVQKCSTSSRRPTLRAYSAASRNSTAISTRCSAGSSAASNKQRRP